MRVIYKYKLEVADIQTLEMPEGYELLTAQMQNDDICIWAEVDTDNPPASVEVAVFGTGHRMYHADEGFKYLGTVQPSAHLVFHVYAR